MWDTKGASGVVQNGTFVADRIIVGLTFCEFFNRSGPIFRECFIDSVCDIGGVRIIAVALPELLYEVCFVIVDDFLFPALALRLS